MAVIADALEEVVEWISISCLACLLQSSQKIRSMIDNPLSWRRLCVGLWMDKTYVPKTCRDLLAEGCPKQAVRDSIKDARRSCITSEELCSFTWYCRMKGSAGKLWTSRDPWWRGGGAKRRQFAINGEVMEPSSTEGNWEPCVLDGQIVKWYFSSWVPEWIEEHSDSGNNRRPVPRLIPEGSRVKIGEYPTYLVWRHPITWGFVLDSPWSLMTSFELPSRGSIKHGSYKVQELAHTLIDSNLRNSVHASALECDFYRCDIPVPRTAPAPEHLFAQQDEDGDLEFCIRSEQEDLPPDCELDDREEAEEEHAELGGESEEGELESEDFESSIEQDVEDGDEA